MTVATCLLLYSLAVVVLAPRLLAPLTRSGAAPRLGVAVWLSAIGSVPAAWLAASGFLVWEAARVWADPAVTVSGCVTTLGAILSGEAGVVAQAGLLGLALLAALALATVVWRWGHTLLRARRRTHGHARMARVAGRHVPDLDAVVVDAPDRLAYCAAGRPHTIVVTTATLDALDRPHLAAVLAHERAHLSGRHHLLLATTRGLAAVLPRVALFTAGATEVARLLEMCADDAAARSHGPRTVLGALLTLSGAASPPVGTLGATGVGLADRAERLLDPASAGQRLRTRGILAVALLLVLPGPVVTAILAAHDVAVCYPVT